MLIYLLVLIILLFIIWYYINIALNKREEFIIKKRGIARIKNKIDKFTKISFEKKIYKNIAKYISKMREKKTNSTVFLDIIYKHYKTHDDKEGFRTFMINKTPLMNEEDNLECKLFEKCDKTGTTGVCGTLLSNITKSMKETENCAHYKSVIDDIKQLVDEKSETKEE